MCRQRIQQVTLGHRGRSGDPLYGIKRVLLTRKVLRTDKQKARLEAVFADEQHIDVEVTEHLYQDLVAAYSDPDKRTGKLTHVQNAQTHQIRCTGRACGVGSARS